MSSRAKRRGHPPSEPRVESTSKYRAEYVDTVKQMVLLEFDDDEICCALEINRSTLMKWRLTHPELEEALARSDHQKNRLAEKALLNFAIGYDRRVQKILHVPGSTDCIFTYITEQVPPNLSALKFLLNNWWPDRWQKDREIPPQPPRPFPSPEERALKKRVMDFIERNAMRRGPDLLGPGGVVELELKKQRELEEDAKNSRSEQ